MTFNLYRVVVNNKVNFHEFIVNQTSSKLTYAVVHLL